MRVLVLWADGRSANLGVRVLADGMAALARQAWGDDTVVDSQDYGPGDSEIGFGGRTIIRDVGRSRGPIATKLSGYDVVLDSGAGDSFADIYGLKRLVIMNYAHRTASRLGVPLMLGPQTIGPFRSGIGRLLGRDSLRRMSIVLPRDSESEQYTAELGHPADVLSTDVVFALPVPRPSSRADVLVNVSGLLWQENDHVDAARYRADVRALLDGLIAGGRRVTLLAHVLDNESQDNDVSVVTALAEEFGGAVGLAIPSDLEDARRLIGGASILIGSRMHACLNALSLGVPAIPWAYSRKFAPLMADLGWRIGHDLRSPGSPVAATLVEVAASADGSHSPALVTMRLEAENRLERAAELMAGLFSAPAKTDADGERHR